MSDLAALSELLKQARWVDLGYAEAQPEIGEPEVFHVTRGNPHMAAEASTLETALRMVTR